jgi:hypothetical protein
MSTLEPVHTVIVRVWLPDRPGALGQVASRIGSVRGDVLGIEILEVGGGRVIDELVVALPDAQLVDLMVNEVHAIDGVAVEHVRPIAGDHSDGGLLALSVAAEVAETDADGRLDAFAEGVQRLTESDWAMVVRAGEAVAVCGDAPSADWITSLISGSSHLPGNHAAAGDMFWADLPTAGMWVAAGREGRPVHERERVRLDLFVRIADALFG